MLGKQSLVCEVVRCCLALAASIEGGRASTIDTSGVTPRRCGLRSGYTQLCRACVSPPPQLSSSAVERKGSGRYPLLQVQSYALQGPLLAKPVLADKSTNRLLKEVRSPGAPSLARSAPHTGAGEPILLYQTLDIGSRSARSMLTQCPVSTLATCLPTQQARKAQHKRGAGQQGASSRAVVTFTFTHKLFLTHRPNVSRNAQECYTVADYSSALQTRQGYASAPCRHAAFPLSASTADIIASRGDDPTPSSTGVHHSEGE
eukprot:636383-Prorocentrum_minimum.AAC.3